MKIKDNSAVGVVVGRFQVPFPHAGHCHLINEVLKRHRQVLIVVGCSKGDPSGENPLTYEMREEMLKSAFPRAQVAQLFDNPISHDNWSLDLDDLIFRHFPHRNAILYASRKGFIPDYTGSYQTKYVKSIHLTSGTHIREEVARTARNTVEFRTGVIATLERRRPISYQTADIAILRDNNSRVLLGSKGVAIDGKDLRFLGGFIDTTDQSLEDGILREKDEEAGRKLLIKNLCYVGSTRVNDFRYRESRDAIMTALFRAEYSRGRAVPGDDMPILEWVNVSDVPKLLIPIHRPLGKLLLRNLKKQ